MQLSDSWLEGWAITDRKNLNKCWIVPVGWDYPGYMYRLEDKRLESSLTEGELGVLVDKLNMSQHCALEAKRANWILECIRPSTASSARCCPLSAEPLLRTVWPQLEHCVEVWAPQ